MDTTLRCLLLALVLSTSVDDLWAVATPDPSDDLAATEDNDYTPAARKPPDQRPRETADTHPVVVPKANSVHPALISPGGPSARTDARPFYCPDLLYSFMSLQR
jgi:hypothetical protein